MHSKLSKSHNLKFKTPIIGKKDLALTARIPIATGSLGGQEKDKVENTTRSFWRNARTTREAFSLAESRSGQYGQTKPFNSRMQSLHQTSTARDSLLKSTIKVIKTTKRDQLSQSEQNISSQQVETDENVTDIFNLDSWVENKKSSRYS